MFVFLSILFKFSASLAIEPNEERLFVNWMRETKNLYVGEEYHFRLGVWLTNYQFVRSKNKVSSRFKCGMNSLSALTASEYRSYYGYQNKAENPAQKPKKAKPSQTRKVPNGVFPRNSDIRSHFPSVLNPIQDVGACKGGSWAFAITTSIETNYCLKKGNLYKLSEQLLIDCVTDCDGCTSGNVLKAFSFLAHDKVFMLRLNTESDYPWTGTKSECKFDVDKSLSLASGYGHATVNVEDEMVGIVNGAVACINMDASLTSFQLYASGIYDDKDCVNSANHAVNVVGYGVTGDDDEVDTKYWICRNCWGKSWGEEGYFRLLRDVNQCNINGFYVSPLKF